MRLGVPAAIRWRKSRIDRLDGQAAQCRRPVRRRVKEQKVDVIVGGSKPGIAWGQFLDPDHHSGTHWGRFGTTAAVQVLAMDLHWERNESFRKEVANVHPLMYLAPDVLLTNNLGKDLPRELKPDDLEDPMKVAFLVDAYNPDECEEVSNEKPPEIAERLLQMAVDSDGWSTRPEGDDDRNEKDRLLITAYALWALRRLPKAQLDARIDGAATWLANELIEGRLSLGQDILALGGLALAHSHPEVRARIPVENAISSCLAELRKWARGMREPTVGRPYFNCYSRGAGNDYIFLSPELLAALLFLTADKQRDSRAFVLRVVDSVAENIVPAGMPPELRERPHGFSIQRGMEGTVDQMWAMRLLRTFHKRRVEDPHSVRPSRVGTPGIFTLITFLALVGTVATKPELNVLNVILAAILSAVLGVAIFEFRQQSES
jgi:hypothetical protein